MNEVKNPTYGSRIIYKPSSVPGVLSSTETFYVRMGDTRLHYRAYVDLNNKKWFIREENKSEIVSQGVGSSKHKMLIKAKNELKKLGVQFNTEGRKKRLKE
jgi:hypothetical protein